MEMKEIFNVKVSNLVNLPFSLKWSIDNNISLINEDGIHIFVSKSK